MQLVGVEHLAGKGDAEVAEGFAASVLLVSSNGVADVGEMHADLMRSAGQGLDAQVRGVIEALQDAIAGECFSSLGGGGDHLFSVLAAAGDMRLDESAFFGRRSDDNSAVFLVNRAGLELLCEPVVCHIVLSHDDAAGGVLIQPVNNAGAKRMPASGKLSAVGEQRVDKGVRRITCCWVHDETRGFVDHDEVIVFVKDVEGDVLGFESGFLRRRKNRFDSITGLDRMVRLDLLPVESDKSLLDELLNVRPRPVGKLLRKKSIQPRARAGFRYDKIHMFINKR